MHEFETKSPSNHLFHNKNESELQLNQEDLSIRSFSLVGVFDHMSSPVMFHLEEHFANVLKYSVIDVLLRMLF